jgi:DNA-binding NtrC family response regulator
MSRIRGGFVADFTNKTVLVVDDEPCIREMLRDRFENLGARVLEAEGGEQALMLIEKTKVHAVISDIRMSGGDGLTLLDKIRGRYPRVPVVCLVSGNADITNEEVLLRGGLGLLQKPFHMNHLVSVVAEGLSQVETQS